MGTGVKWFNLNIQEYCKELLDNQGLRLRAIGVIKYPVYFIQATIRKYVDDDTYSLDYQILKIIDYFGVTDEKSINLILGVMEGVVRWRIDILEGSGYLMVSNDKIELTEDGAELVRKPDQRIEITVTDNFYVDGYTLKPLASEFYQKHKKYGAIHTFIKHGDFDFEPDILHTPPGDTIIENIMSVPVDKRSAYSIPGGLIELIDFDPVRVIHPLGVVYASNDNGEITKRLIDCCDSCPTDDFLAEQKDLLQDRIDNLFIQPIKKIIKSKDDIEQDKEIIKFGSSWDFQKSSENNVIFNIGKHNLKAIISNHINIEIIEAEDIQISDVSIKWKIDKKYFKNNIENKQLLIGYLSRERHYIFQHEFTGIWLVFIEFIPNDQFVKDLLKLLSIIENDKPNWNELINDFGLNYLRELLISIGKYFDLESLDSYLFLSSFSAGKYIKPRFRSEKQS